MTEHRAEIDETIDLTNAVSERVVMGYIPDTVCEVIGELTQRRDRQRGRGEYDAAQHTERQAFDIHGLAMPCPRERAVVDHDKATVTFEDGKPINVRSGHALAYVAVLIAADGEWRTQSQVWRDDPMLEEVRLRDLHRRLPAEVKARIEVDSVGKLGRRWKTRP